ncbi:lipopolysaccharide heptosyltransferase family protein [Fusobacterium polymorphum]|uniref:glycosyltransferase family 9 protein n=1 Tax=Fusobacterium nucleatum subsp. polymorphum TaxID=76857 RepID=UPI0030CB8675
MLKKVWKQKLLNSYMKFFLKEPKIDDNIFITSTDGIGDNIIRLNLLEEILNQYGNDKCYILCDIKVVPLLKTIGFKNIIVFTKRMRRYLFGKIKLLKFLYQKGFNKIISLEYDQHDFDIQYFKNLDSYCLDNKFHPEMNQYYKNVISTDFKVTEETIVKAFKILFNKNIVEQDAIPNLRKYYSKKLENMDTLVVGIGAGARNKMLKPNLLCEILKLFIKKKNIKKIIFLGAGDRDQKYLNEMKKYINFTDFNIENLVNKISLDESIDIISEYPYYLGFESGLFHIAASLKIKTYGIFTEINEFSHNNWENVTLFSGSPSTSNNDEYFGNSKLNNISPEEIEKLL